MRGKLGPCAQNVALHALNIQQQARVCNPPSVDSNRSSIEFSAKEFCGYEII